jgi:hypothetical protein
MDNVLVCLVYDWLMNLSNFLCVYNRLNVLVGDILMVLVNNVLMVLMNHILVVLMYNLAMVFLYNWLSNGSLNSGCNLVSLDYGRSSVLLKEGSLLMPNNCRHCVFSSFNNGY